MSFFRPSPLARLLTWLILGYRLLLGPLLGPRCRFEPSCSSYALDAVREYGAARGMALAGWRLLRCQPFSRGGFDPVRPRRSRAGRDDRDSAPPPGAPGPSTSGAFRC